MTDKISFAQFFRFLLKYNTQRPIKSAPQYYFAPASQNHSVTYKIVNLKSQIANLKSIIYRPLLASRIYFCSAMVMDGVSGVGAMMSIRKPFSFAASIVDLP